MEERVEIAELAACGVILLDEFDKWIGTKDPMGRNIGERLQSDLLKLIEGEVVWVNDNDSELGVPLDTSRILIIACGAFVGLEKIVGTRMSGETSADSRTTTQITAWANIEPADFIKFGMMPQLAGRMSTYVMMKPLNEANLLGIVDVTMDEYRARFDALDVHLAVMPSAKAEIARAALKLRVGARSIRFVLERVFAEALFEAGMGRTGHIDLDSGQVALRRAEIR
jgi:ATP-dependent Clp protease ATP-binding subunit ClpX